VSRHFLSSVIIMCHQTTTPTTWAVCGTLMEDTIN
jgi:hypothetical protein